MDKYLTLGLVLGAIVASYSSLPTMPWDDEDVSLMCMISIDYYNKVSGERSFYRLHRNGTRYRLDETSSYHQLHFNIKETACQKPWDEESDDCAFIEDGVVKSCAASFMVEDGRDVTMVICERVNPQRPNRRRSRSNERGNAGRNGRCNGGQNRRGDRRCNRGGLDLDLPLEGNKTSA